jgi:hypothetical protein
MTLNAPSYLPALVGSRLHGSSLLASLSANRPATNDPASEPERTKTKAAAATPSSAATQAQKDIAQFRRVLATAKTPAELLGNSTALKVLLTANGLAGNGVNSALAARALLSNPARSNSLLNQLGDSRWAGANKCYSFATKGLSALKDPATLAAITRSYTEALTGAGGCARAEAPAGTETLAGGGALAEGEARAEGKALAAGEALPGSEGLAGAGQDQTPDRRPA